MGLMVSQIEDIMFEIFIRLPIKSIFRFMCVSKHWHSLLSHPSFRRKHSSHQSPPDSSISAIFFGNHSFCSYCPPEFAPIDKPNSGVPDPSLSFLGRGFSVSHSCNGLLLCEQLPYYRRGDKNITYCVCNPTTKEYVLLPQPIQQPIQQPYYPISSISIAFDPSKSAHYKVVCISVFISSTETSDCRVNIYSSETGLWRLSELCPRIYTINGNGVFWNGLLHWTTRGDQSTLSFHVEKELFQTTKLPPKPTPIYVARVCKYFGESNGHLYLIETYDLMDPEFHILEMEPDYSQWSVRYSVNLDPILKAYPLVYPGSFTGLHLLVGERGELLLWVTIPWKIIWYRITDGTFGKHCDLATPRADYLHGYAWREVHPFSNTLSSVRPPPS